MARSARRWRNRIAYILFLVVLALATGEIFLRLTGRSGWAEPNKTIEVEPGGSFFRPHPVLGYAGQPGTLQVTLQDSLHFTVSHNEQGYRLTQPPLDSADTRPQIWIFGCSFTHGYGVEDNEAYPWLFQERFPQYQVRNFAMTGYGTYHSLLQLQSLLENEAPPAVVMLAYGAFHDQRNVNSRYWKKALAGQEVAKDIQYPFMRYNEADSLVAYLERPDYTPWTGQRWSALVHFLEKQSNGAEEQELRSGEVTREMIGEMGALCQEKGIEMALLGIFKNPGTEQVLKEFEGKMRVLDISVDTEDPSLRILPDDGHPNAEGHRQMAEKLVNWFE